MWGIASSYVLLQDSANAKPEDTPRGHISGCLYTDKDEAGDHHLRSRMLRSAKSARRQVTSLMEDCMWARQSPDRCGMCEERSGVRVAVGGLSSVWSLSRMKSAAESAFSLARNAGPLVSDGSEAYFPL
jgi:hypothetical protein